MSARSDAAAAGQLTYRNNRPCKRGHDPVRYTSSGGCVVCCEERCKIAYSAAAPLRIRKAQERYAAIKADSVLHQEYINKRRSLARSYKKIPKPTRPEPKSCECCGGVPNGRHKRLHVDHCHETGKFRGWLCFSCNSAIGKLGDNVAGVQRALDYLNGRSS